MADEIMDTQESKSLIDPDHESDDSSDAESRFLYFICFVVSSGFFLLGYDYGSTSSSMIFIADYFSLTSFWYELIVSAAIGTAVIGTLISGYCNDLFGRKKSSIVYCVVFVIGTLIMACARSKEELLLGRLFAGLAYGKIMSTLVNLHTTVNCLPGGRGVSGNHMEFDIFGTNS